MSGFRTNLGLMPYSEAFELQRRALEQVSNDRFPDLLLEVEHPPVYTLGANFHAENLPLPAEEYAKAVVANANPTYSRLEDLSAGADRLLADFGSWDALVVGPGLGRSPEAERLVLKLLGKWRGPMILDADALNALASYGADSWVPRAREIRAAGVGGGLVEVEGGTGEGAEGEVGAGDVRGAEGEGVGARAPLGEVVVEVGGVLDDEVVADVLGGEGLAAREGAADVVAIAVGDAVAGEGLAQEPLGQVVIGDDVGEGGCGEEGDGEGDGEGGECCGDLHVYVLWSTN